MNETTYIRRRLKRWCEVAREVLDESAVMAQLQKGLSEPLEAEAREKAYRIDGCEFHVSDANSDVFARNKVALLCELTVLLTEEQDHQWRIDETQAWIESLRRELANGPTREYDKLETNGVWERRYETPAEARERVVRDLERAEEHLAELMQ